MDDKLPKEVDLAEQILREASKPKTTVFIGMQILANINCDNCNTRQTISVIKRNKKCIVCNKPIYVFKRPEQNRQEGDNA